MRRTRTLGTLLRHLIDLLDADVEGQYLDAGLDYRPRFTPVMRLLSDEGPSLIRDIAEFAGITHSAASQTVAEMVKRGLVSSEAGKDGRERIIQLTPKGQDMMPKLRAQWAATQQAALALEQEIGLPLHDALAEAISAVEKTSFRARLSRAAGVRPQ